MKVINIHKRVINQPKHKVSHLFKSLTTSNDMIWPYKNWPAMRFKKGLEVGNKGGHGQIRYTITEFKEGNHIKFKFTKPHGFNGFHELRINSVGKNSSEIVHCIKMSTTFKASLMWLIVIRWLHNALIEDALINVENYFSEEKKKNKYNFWVKLLRAYYQRKRIKTITFN
nr:hypothetical protein [uncultured Psychroserpens sp.]